MSDLPLFPTPGPETVINEPGHYKGYFCNFCPDAGTDYDYKPPANWRATTCSEMPGVGSHGCCNFCVVVLIDLIYAPTTFPVNIISNPLNATIKVDNELI